MSSLVLITVGWALCVGLVAYMIATAPEGYEDETAGFIPGRPEPKSLSRPPSSESPAENRARPAQAEEASTNLKRENLSPKEEP